MAQPTASDVHVNVPLTNMSVAFQQSSTAFVAANAFPMLPVEKQSDRYYVYLRGEWNRDEMPVRAPGTESAGSGYNLDNTPTYYTPVYSLHKDVADQIRANSDSMLNPDADATRFLTNRALITRERNFAAAYFVSGANWTGTATATAITGSVSYSSLNAPTVLNWNDPASTPIEDVRFAKQQMLINGGGIPANKMILGKQVYDKLLDHPDIVDRIKYGQTPGNPAMANSQILAQLFELDDILVMSSVYNTAIENQAGTAESNSFIGGKNALLVHAAPSPGLLTPTAGYMFSWAGYVNGPAGPLSSDLAAYGTRISQFRMEWLKSDRVEIEASYQFKQVSADLGYLFSSVIA